MSAAASPAPVAIEWRAAFRVVSTGLGVVLLAGFASGVVVAGILGRLAMLVLRFTSDDFVRGIETDDGFTIGVFSRDTLFLLLFCGLLGMIAAVGYGAFRGAVPHRWRAPAATLVAGAVGGSLIIEPGGVDFTLLDPQALAVAMFIVVPALYGLGMSLLVERMLPSQWWRQGRAAWPLLTLGFIPALAGPQATATAAVLVCGTLARREPLLANPWRYAAARWVGRLILAALAIAASVELGRDVSRIL